MLTFFTAQQVLNIPEDALPLIVLSENTSSLFSARIKRHTCGLYNHAMILWKIEETDTHCPRPEVATQEILLRSCPLSDYLRGKHRLKFWTRPDWTPDIRDHIREKIARRLALPWYKRLYDPIGIIGHAIGLTRLHIPALHYCSEFIADVLGRDNILVRQPSPADINRIFKNHPGIWKVFGRYDPDIFPGTDDGEQIINMKG